ncbi:hypothetical protein INT44_000572 [Umbelopsis vinacea]|uniref:Aminoglycoside phosphotransferase domain-containing protein n=1 Tax=Umbelopsis vinacea TaxID=44442 RepID=A0A8H7UDN6_9FUNG|nr:hypothetical protein INT44_000572 [Umbelopsis vinacea]
MARETTPPPQQGVHIEFEKAAVIVKEATGTTLQAYKESGLGYNNRIYYCQVDDEEKLVLKVVYAKNFFTEKVPNIIRMSIFKVQGRFWTKIKTDTEVAGIRLAKQYTTTPVPDVLDWNNSPKKYGHEYLLMSKLPGVSLDHEWGSLDSKQKQDLLEQLAAYIGELKQNICIGSQIGNFAFGANNTLELGKTVEASIGPWDSYQEMMINQLENKLDALQRQDNYGFLLRVFGDQVSDLLHSFKSGERALFPAPQRVFTHGDLNERNIMVTRVQEGEMTTLKIVGLLDFEWSGMFPCTEEYFASYEFLNSEPSLKKGFYERLEHHHVATPHTIPNFNSHAKLIELREAIAPWWVTENTNAEDKEKCLQGLSAALEAVKAMPR